MKFGSLFSGIGGMDLGLERAGMECAWQVEIDEFCRKVLTKHWPNVPKFNDVREVGKHNLEPVDLIAGGFPCQDISNAAQGGKGRRGISGERSGLWSEFYRIICQLRPRFVLVENVPAITLRGLDRVLMNLAEGGYDAEWDCLPASVFGAPHRRERFFLIAYPCEVGRSNGARYYFKDGVPRDAHWGLTQDFKSGTQWKRWAIAASQAVDGEVSESDFCSVDDGLRKELDGIAAFGNAVVPQVAEWIGERILEAEALNASDFQTQQTGKLDVVCSESK
jgi:DNA (cytosine-5)-methyltransferase 1